MTILDDIRAMIAAVRAGDYLGALASLAAILTKIGILPSMPPVQPAGAPQSFGTLQAMGPSATPDQFCCALEAAVDDIEAQQAAGAPQESISALIGILLPIIMKFLADWWAKRS